MRRPSRPTRCSAAWQPQTLRWLNATAAVQEFLGCTMNVLRQRTFPEFLHPEDRALAEDEFRQAGEIGSAMISS